MTPKFNIDRPKISDEEINKHKNFEQLVKQFKSESIQKARHDKSWWKSKKVRYSAVIAGITVICTVSYFTLFNNQNHKLNETITTPNELSNNTQEARNKKPLTRSFVSAPSKKLAVPYTSYKVNNSKGREINHTTTSKIKIPKNTFVDKNGREIIGDVTIEYREFHDKGDIIASGVPMAYDSAGKKYNLESAGMFDIKGSQNGEAVFIREGNDLKIELASANNEDRFNQYFLDTIERNWKYIKHDDATSKEDVNSKNQHLNKSKIAALKKDIEVVIPKRIDSVKIAYTKKAEALPKAKQPLKPSQPTGRPTFFIDGSQDEFPELAAFDKVIFEVGEENNNYSKDMHDITWSDVKVSEGPQKGKNYLLTLTYRKRVEKLIVYPVLSGADFEKAQKKYQQKFTEYQDLAEKRVSNEKKLMAEMEAKQKTYYAEIDQKRRSIEELSRQRDFSNLNNNFSVMSNSTRAIRIFSISKFGIYNSDCPRSMPEGKEVIPQFILSDNSKPVSIDLIYLVDHTGNTVYNFTSADFNKIKYNPASTNSFVVFSQNRMYLCGKNAFKQSSENNSQTFIVTQLPESADNLIDFKKALEI